MSRLFDELRRFIVDGQELAPVPESDAPSISPMEMILLEVITEYPGAVGSLIEKTSGVKRGSVYVMLGRLEDKGLLSSSTANGCRQYRITPLGQRLYRAELVCRAARALAVAPG